MPSSPLSVFIEPGTPPVSPHPSPVETLFPGVGVALPEGTPVLLGWVRDVAWKVYPVFPGQMGEWSMYVFPGIPSGTWVEGIEFTLPNESVSIALVRVLQWGDRPCTSPWPVQWAQLTQWLEAAECLERPAVLLGVPYMTTRWCPERSQDLTHLVPYRVSEWQGWAWTSEHDHEVVSVLLPGWTRGERRASARCQAQAKGRSPANSPTDEPTSLQRAQERAACRARNQHLWASMDASPSLSSRRAQSPSYVEFPRPIRSQVVPTRRVRMVPFPGGSGRWERCRITPQPTPDLYSVETPEAGGRWKEAGWAHVPDCDTSRALNRLFHGGRAFDTVDGIEASDSDSDDENHSMKVDEERPPSHVLRCEWMPHSKRWRPDMADPCL
jgi:hypothetical protein